MKRLTDEHRALLRMVQAPPVPEAPPAPEVLPAPDDRRGPLRIDWDALASIAVANNLAALLHYRIIEEGAASAHRLPEPPPVVLERLARDRWFCLAQGHALHSAFDDISGTIAARGHEVLPLKGLLFSRTLYPTPDLRPMVDVDLLVRPEEIVAIGEIFASQGYEPKGPNIRPVTQAEMFETRWAKATGPFLVIVELHRALGQPSRYRVDDAGLWERAVSLARYGAQSWGAARRALSPEDTVLHLCLHQSNHMFDEVDLRAVVDCDAVVRTWNPDWETIVARAARWGVATALHLTARTAKALMATPIPDTVLTRTRPAQPRRAWLEWLIDADGLGAYRYDTHPAWLKRAMVGFAVMDRFSDRLRFARNYASLRVRDWLADPPWS